MTVIETSRLTSNTSLHVAWIAGDKSNISRRYIASGEYLSWKEGLDISLLDNMVIQTLVVSGLMANDRIRREYSVRARKDGLVVVNLSSMKELMRLSKAEMDSLKPDTYKWNDSETGLVFAINR